MDQHDTVFTWQSANVVEEFAIIFLANVFEHANRNDPVELAFQHAAFTQLETQARTGRGVRRPL
ncbi:MAG: hypothetical protein RIE31_01950 [Alphaproteobacteria bacterium]